MRVMGLLVAIVASGAALGAPLQISTFQVDVTPPLGSPLCGGGVQPAKTIADPLSARGVVLFPEGQAPIVLGAVDWVGIAHEGLDLWRQALADAAATSIDRVAVHCLHQHDAPFCDFTTEALLEEHGLGGRTFDRDFARDAIARTAEAVNASVSSPSPVSHIGTGEAAVEKVASNRRILGDDGKVKAVRWTATVDPEVRAEPEGVIDPMLKLISFWNGESPVALMTYYATHPQSHYGKGEVSADFVGMARALREQALPDMAHIHFNGASGNIGAGKYNDGAPENRPVLAGRLADGMRRAWEATERHAVDPDAIRWSTKMVMMPLRAEIDLEHERALLADADANPGERVRAAREIAWIQRQQLGKGAELALLELGPACVLHMPGELFVEYQLASQTMRPDSMVAMAAYGDYGCGYIGTEISYDQGGYETGLRISRTAPEVEEVLMNAMRQLLSLEEQHSP
jgi:hypothetical protein